MEIIPISFEVDQSWFRENSVSRIVGELARLIEERGNEEMSEKLYKLQPILDSLGMAARNIK